MPSPRNRMTLRALPPWIAERTSAVRSPVPADERALSLSEPLVARATGAAATSAAPSAPATSHRRRPVSSEAMFLLFGDFGKYESGFRTRVISPVACVPRRDGGGGPGDRWPNSWLHGGDREHVGY